jgi:hypothetical protein
MLVRTTAALFVAVFFGSLLNAQEKNENLAVGDFVVVDLTGKLAMEFSRCCGDTGTNSPSPIVSTIGTITGKTADGRFRVELSVPTKRQGVAPRLVTLSMTVDAKDITTQVTPKDTATYASPADSARAVKPTMTTKETKSRHLALSDLKGAKLQTWVLVDEIGE